MSGSAWRFVTVLCLVAPTPIIGAIIPLSQEVNGSIGFGGTAQTRIFVGTQEFTRAIIGPQTVASVSISLSGLIDTDALEIRNVSATAAILTPAPPNESFIINTTPIEVTNTITVDPPGFDPPITTVTPLGEIAVSTTTTLQRDPIQIVLDLPETLPIDPVTLGVGAFPAFTASASVQTTGKTFLDGVPQTQFSLAPIGDFVRTASLIISCTQSPTPDCSAFIDGASVPGVGTQVAGLSLGSFGITPPAGGTNSINGVTVLHFVVPEPGSGSLVLVGLALLSLRRRGRL